MGNDGLYVDDEFMTGGQVLRGSFYNEIAPNYHHSRPDSTQLNGSCHDLMTRDLDDTTQQSFAANSNVPTSQKLLFDNMSS